MWIVFIPASTSRIHKQTIWLLPKVLGLKNVLLVWPVDGKNIPAQNPTDYYRLSLTIPLLDHLINELQLRFDENSSNNISEFLSLLPATICKSHTIIDRDTFQSVFHLYEDDFPALLSLDAELNLRQQHWTAYLDLASQLNTAEKALCHADKDFHPNINVLLRIMVTLPVTSCECEHSISLLRLVKSSLRSSMGQNRLNGLALLHRLCDNNLRRSSRGICYKSSTMYEIIESWKWWVN